MFPMRRAHKNETDGDDDAPSTVIDAAAAYFGVSFTTVPPSKSVQ